MLLDPMARASQVLGTDAMDSIPFTQDSFASSMDAQ